MIALQFIALLLFGAVILSLIPNKWVAYFFSALFSFFATLQFISFYLTGNLIDYKFVEHANFADIWSVRGYYTGEIILGILAFIMIFILSLLIYRYVRKRRISKWITLILIIGSGLFICIPKTSIGHQLYDVYSIKTSKSTGFNNALTQLGIDPEKYITSDLITATPGKNIIVLSLESFEKGYLSPNVNLTPTLSRLKETHTYYDMEQNQGSSWTEASIYSSLTGMPAYFKSPKNETFNNTKIQSIANLGAVLKSAGYDMTYLLAKKEFSGLNDLLTNFGFTVLSNEDSKTKSNDSYWGLQDKDLFDMTTEQILSKKDNNKPFAIFLNTISGHFPEGVYDERLASVFPERSTKLEFMTYAVDHFIGELYHTLEKNDMLKNTEIFIYPDHQFIGEPVKLVSGFPEERGLFLITTATEESLNYTTKKPLSQLHLPRLIINGSGIKTNATFLVDYYKGADINNFTENNIKNILSVNEPMTERYTYSNQIDLRYHNNEVILKQEDGYETKLSGIKKNELYQIYFDHNDRYKKFNKIDSTKNWQTGQNLTLVFSIKNNTLFSSLSKYERIGIAKHGNKTVRYTEEEIDIFEDWTIVHPNIKKNINVFHCKSVVGDAVTTRGKSFMYTGEETHLLNKGINLISIQNNVFYVENFNVMDNPEAATSFIKRMQKLIPNKYPFALAVDEGIGNAFKSHSKELESFGLNELAILDSKTGYISYMNNDGYMIEMTDHHSKYYTAPIYFLNKKYMTQWLVDTPRYIANSGGIIDNKSTTNSLEALNSNYEKGFRYFELDLRETSDGKLVAVRDWKFWKEMTGYEGETPPSLAVFKNHKLFDKYTALDSKAINTWLNEHPDAILVTDAINNPLKVSETSIDVSRVMMKLDDEKAIQEAQALGFMDTPIDYRLLSSFGANKLERLKALNLTTVTIPHRVLQNNKTMFKNLTDNGIKIYVINVDFEPVKNEKYVFNYDFGLVYGMYANDWLFSTD